MSYMSSILKARWTGNIGRASVISLCLLHVGNISWLQKCNGTNASNKILCIPREGNVSSMQAEMQHEWMCQMKWEKPIWGGGGGEDVCSTAIWCNLNVSDNVIGHNQNVIQTTLTGQRSSPHYTAVHCDTIILKEAYMPVYMKQFSA